MQITRNFSSSKLIIIYCTQLFSFYPYYQRPKAWSHKISSESVQYNRFYNALIESLLFTFAPFQRGGRHLEHTLWKSRSESFTLSKAFDLFNWFDVCERITKYFDITFTNFQLKINKTDGIRAIHSGLDFFGTLCMSHSNLLYFEGEK